MPAHRTGVGQRRRLVDDHPSSGGVVGCGPPVLGQRGIERVGAPVPQGGDELAAKLDVKSQAKEKVASLKDSATTDSGTPRAEVLAAAGSLVAMAVVLLLWRRWHHH